MGKELPRNKDGKKMYPVCNWERNQHKVYNAYERAWNRWYEEKSEEAEKELERVQIAYDSYDSTIINGIVYATWEDGEIIKDLIAGYDIRH